MRKILSVLVCVCIMLSCVSFSALAQTGTDRNFTFSDFTEPLGSFGSETNAKTSFGKHSERFKRKLRKALLLGAGNGNVW